MNERQQRELDSVTRTHLFLTRNSNLSPELAAIAKTLSSLEHQIRPLRVEEMMRFAPGQRESAARQANLLRLRYMIPLARRGKLLLRGESRLEAAFRVPHKRAAVTEVLTAARRMIAAIGPHKRLFTEAGSSSRFLTDFRAAVKRLEQTIKLESKFKSVAPRARAELKRLLALARAEVRVAASLVPIWIESLDANKRGGLGAEWRSSHRITARLGRPSARRVEHRRRRERRAAGEASAT